MADDRWLMAGLWWFYEKHQGFVIDFSDPFHGITPYIKLNPDNGLPPTPSPLRTRSVIGHRTTVGL